VVEDSIRIGLAGERGVCHTPESVSNTGPQSLGFQLLYHCREMYGSTQKVRECIAWLLNNIPMRRFTPLMWVVDSLFDEPIPLHKLHSRASMLLSTMSTDTTQWTLYEKWQLDGSFFRENMYVCAKYLCPSLTDCFSERPREN